MIFTSGSIFASLKRAREAKGLSQRALSDIAHVPQSHISLIERGGVDLRVSSLAALARALDLELMLVPRQRLSAVKSIAQSAIEPVRQPGPATRRAWRNFMHKVDKLIRADPGRTAAAQLQRLARDLLHVGFVGTDLPQARELNRRLAKILETHDSSALDDLLNDLQHLRNSAMHTAASDRDRDNARPAYSLETLGNGK